METDPRKLLEGDPGFVLSVLDDPERVRSLVKDMGFWLRQLATLCRRTATELMGTEPRSADRWAAVALRCYRLSEGLGLESPESSRVAALSLIALLISNIGPDDAVEARSPKRLEEEFSSIVKTSPDETLSMAENWMELELSDILYLRALKARLKAIELASERLPDWREHRFKQWLDLVTRLP